MNKGRFTDNELHTIFELITKYYNKEKLLTSDKSDILYLRKRIMEEKGS